jgi:hypothetical protein
MEKKLVMRGMIGFLIVSCGAIQARGGANGPQPQQQQGGGPGQRQPGTPGQPRRGGQGRRPNNSVTLSQAAQVLLKTNSAWTSGTLQVALDNNRPSLNTVDIDVIEDQIDDLREKEAKEEARRFESKKMSDEEKEKREARLEREQMIQTIRNLTNELTARRMGFLESASARLLDASKFIGTAGLGGAAAWLAAGAATGGIALGAGAALSLKYGFDYIVAKSQTGELSAAIASFIGENFLMNALNDTGRYPSCNAQMAGLENDILNTSSMDDTAFKKYKADVRTKILTKWNEAFKAHPAIKVDQEKLDREIIAVQAKYPDTDPAIRMKKIRDDTTENITHAQALVSEYMRAAFRYEQQQELLLLKQNEQQPNPQQSPQTKPQPTWWEKFKKKNW